LEILTLTLDRSGLVFAARQIDQILDWPAKVGFPVLQLSRALRGDGAVAIGSGEGRVLVCADGKGGQVGFVVPAEIRQQVAVPGSLLHIPKVLGRLGPPPWLAGFLMVGPDVSLVVDLKRLAELVCAEPASP
jgi:hypothetical protein